MAMVRLIVVGVLVSGMAAAAEEREVFRLAAPEGWGGETIELPPGFARDMKLNCFEHIRFAPGMMKPGSESFFSYAFVFELQPKPALTEGVVKEEFLTYYRGLCQAVLNGKPPEVDTSKFKLELERLKADDAGAAADKKDTETPAEYTGTLEWVEPFATKKPQKLNLEIRTWTKGDRNYIFACVSPQPRDAAIWKQLRGIREGYLKK
jgi:hypothetical protein